jgi:hypothetical protein
MFVNRMDGPVDREATSRKNPTWEQIEEALLELNGRDKTLLILGAGDPVPHMGIGGGDGKYICYVTQNNLSFDNLENPAAREGQFVPLIAGGQKSDYRAALCVNLETVLRAARTYAETGELAIGLQWKHQGA